MTLREYLIDRYAVLHNLKPRTVVLFGHTLDRFRDFLGREPELTDLDDLQVSKFLRWRAVTPHRGRVPSPASVRKDLAHILSLWNALAKKRLVDAFPDMPKGVVRVPHRPPQAYTAEEVGKMVVTARSSIGHVGPVPAAWLLPTLLLSCWYTGERIGSHLEVRWAEVDRERRTITFLSQHRKGLGRTITRPIGPDLAELLEKGRRPSDELVWPWLQYREMQTLFPRLRTICRAAGVKCRGFHGIRKAAGSYVHAGGGNATEFLTHASGKTTRDHYLAERIIGVESALEYLPPLDLSGNPKPPPAA